MIPSKPLEMLEHCGATFGAGIRNLGLMEQLHHPIIGCRLIRITPQQGKKDSIEAATIFWDYRLSGRKKGAVISERSPDSSSKACRRSCILVCKTRTTWSNVDPALFDSCALLAIVSHHSSLGQAGWHPTHKRLLAGGPQSSRPVQSRNATFCARYQR